MELVEYVFVVVTGKFSAIMRIKETGVVPLHMAYFPISFVPFSASLSVSL